MRKIARVLAVGSLLLAAQPADALIPVEDVVAAARIADVVRHNVAMLNNLIETLSVANAMKAALGEGAGPEWTNAVNSASGLYSQMQQLKFNVANKSASLQWELDQLTPARIQEMSIPELLAFGQRWQQMLSQDALSARAIQAEGIAQQAKINTLRSKGLVNSQQAQGVTSAVQAQSQIIGAVAGQLETTAMTLQSMANMQNNSLMSEAKKNEMVQVFNQRNREIGRQMMSAGPKRAAKSILRWGQP